MSERVHLVSLGCPKNRVDSEVMIGKIRGADCTLVDSPDEADVIVVNTCSFIQPATEESIDTVLEMAGYKEPDVRREADRHRLHGPALRQCARGRAPRG